ncbi:hypothetical protein [Terriglobus roseus]|uniref:Uncharacterized protein n=1 Tax=Terriglobus roseus TaxID=392734 RepID=A0A1H4KF33_9BACT|nr:hypothetical protein [Terriglobus roseus]SEB56725.1 hypothetical protein SAMN05443244_1151 [Terriglobus roseus]
MKNFAQQTVRLVVALMCGVLCLLAAGTAYRLNTQFSRFAVAVFGLAWFAQAYVLRNQIRTVRG